MTEAQKLKYDNAVTSYKDSMNQWINADPRKETPIPTPPDYTSFKKDEGEAKKESPAPQYRLGQKISREGDTTSFEMRPDGVEWSEEDNAMITNMKENIISNEEYRRRMNPSGGKRKVSKVVKSITNQHKSPVYKDGSMAGDQSATRIDYAHPILKHMKR